LSSGIYQTVYASVLSLSEANLFVLGKYLKMRAQTRFAEARITENKSLLFFTNHLRVLCG
ncbi:MAG: hypothetical protein ACYTE8_12120, partial [Planctomycetota bacterium]